MSAKPSLCKRQLGFDGPTSVGTVTQNMKLVSQGEHPAQNPPPLQAGLDNHRSSPSSTTTLASSNGRFSNTSSGLQALQIPAMPSFDRQVTVKVSNVSIDSSSSSSRGVVGGYFGEATQPFSKPPPAKSGPDAVLYNSKKSKRRRLCSLEQFSARTKFVANKYTSLPPGCLSRCVGVRYAQTNGDESSGRRTRRRLNLFVPTLEQCFELAEFGKRFKLPPVTPRYATTPSLPGKRRRLALFPLTSMILPMNARWSLPLDSGAHPGSVQEPAPGSDEDLGSMVDSDSDADSDADEAALNPSEREQSREGVGEGSSDSSAVRESRPPLRRSARLAARAPPRRSARLAAKPRVCYKGMC